MNTHKPKQPKDYIPEPILRWFRQYQAKRLFNSKFKTQKIKWN